MIAPESIRASRLYLGQGIDVCTIEWSTYRANKPSPNYPDLVDHEVEQIRFSRRRAPVPLQFLCTLHDRHLDPMKDRRSDSLWRVPMRLRVTVDHTDWAARLEQPVNPEIAPPYHHIPLDVTESDVFLGCGCPKIRTQPDAAGELQTIVVTHHECTIDLGCDCNGFRHTGDIHSLGITESYQPAFA